MPCATTSPPWTPAPGPMSMTWSAWRIASSSCSTTSTVLPRSREALERLEQAVVVPLVQADRGLVEHVEHAREAAADLAGEADALALAAAKRAAGAVEVEIVEPDIVEEAEALVDLLEDRLGDLVLGRVQLLVQRAEPFERVGDRRGGWTWRCPRPRSSPPALRA